MALESGERLVSPRDGPYERRQRPVATNGGSSIEDFVSHTDAAGR